MDNRIDTAFIEKAYSEELKKRRSGKMTPEQAFAAGVRFILKLKCPGCREDFIPQCAGCGNYWYELVEKNRQLENELMDRDFDLHVNGMHEH